MVHRDGNVPAVTVSKRNALAGALLLVATLAWASNGPWLSKPYDAWTLKDVQSILTESPWVKMIPIHRTWLSESETDVAPQPLINGGIRSWPQDAPNLQGASAQVTVRQSEASQLELNVYVYWYSSRVIRAAFARRSVLRGEIKESDVEPYVRDAPQEYALVLTMGDMTPFLQKGKDEEFFQQHASIVMNSRNRSLSPSHVVYQRDTKGTLKQVDFFFPKTDASGEPTIRPDETDVDFICPIEDLYLHFRFNPQEMTDPGGRDL